MNTLVGAGTSASIRYLCTELAKIDPSAGFNPIQGALFHVLDMAISSFASHFFASRANDGDHAKAVLVGRYCGCIAAAAITTMITGPHNFALLMLISAVSQAVGFVVTVALPKESGLVIV